MAKVRVYELAKDLNITNNQLLEKLKELKIDAKSHMSALDNSDVAAVKQNLLGKKKRSNEVKVRQPVIRRRRTKTRSQTDELETDEDMDDAFGPEEPTVQDQDDQEKATGQEDGAVADEQPEGPVVRDSENAPGSKKRSVRKVVPKTSEPAKIIKPAKVEEPPEPEKVTVDFEEKIEVAPAEDDNVVNQQENENAEAPVVPAESEGEDKDDTFEPADSGEGKSLPKPMGGDQEALRKQEESTAQPTGDEAQDEGSIQHKRKKKKKKTTPAKIVRVADPMVLENLKRMKAGENHSATASDNDRPARRQPEPETHASGGPEQDLAMPPEFPTDRKRGWTRDEDLTSDGPGSRKKRRKKKAVVEGDDLYKGRGGRKKKGKKIPRAKKVVFRKPRSQRPRQSNAA